MLNRKISILLVAHFTLLSLSCLTTADYQPSNPDTVVNDPLMTDGAVAWEKKLSSFGQGVNILNDVFYDSQFGQIITSGGATSSFGDRVMQNYMLSTDGSLTSQVTETLNTDFYVLNSGSVSGSGGYVFAGQSLLSRRWDGFFWATDIFGNTERVEIYGQNFMHEQFVGVAPTDDGVVFVGTTFDADKGIGLVVFLDGLGNTQRVTYENLELGDILIKFTDIIKNPHQANRYLISAYRVTEVALGDTLFSTFWVGMDNRGNFAPERRFSGFTASSTNTIPSGIGSPSEGVIVLAGNAANKPYAPVLENLTELDAFMWIDDQGNYNDTFFGIGGVPDSFFGVSEDGIAVGRGWDPNLQRSVTTIGIWEQEGETYVPKLFPLASSDTFTHQASWSATRTPDGGLVIAGATWHLEDFNNQPRSSEYFLAKVNMDSLKVRVPNIIEKGWPSH